MLRKILDEVSHLLPEQAPLHAFVHHNTLHAFEHLPFENAVVEAAELLGTEAFQKEFEFAKHLRTGRITDVDIDTTVESHGRAGENEIFPGGLTGSEFLRARLKHLFEVPRGQSLTYLLCESDLKDKFHASMPEERKALLLAGSSKSESEILRELWARLHDAAPSRVGPRVGEEERWRDLLLSLTNVDVDESVHPLLIRLCAAYLDQGIAYWKMPNRSKGFLSSVRALYSQVVPPPDRAFRGLAKAFRTHEEERWNAFQTISWALEQLEVGEREVRAYIRESLLALRGWAGMMKHLQLRPDRAPVESVPATLEDFLAVRLVLDVVATKNCVAEHWGRDARLSEVLSSARKETLRKTQSDVDVELVYEAFVLAQLLPVDVSTFADTRHAAAWIEQVKTTDDLERRRLLHLAYERRHRIEVLDGIAAHARMGNKEVPKPVFQAAFCIDDREESLRRHLEECFPAVDTFGYAGFYGVAMNYQGVRDVRPRPLCPVSIQPSHIILEAPVDDKAGAQFRQKRKRLGRFENSLSVGTKTMTRGGLFSMALGSLALIPLVLRSLYPRIAVAWGNAFEHSIAKSPATRLLLEANDETEKLGGKGYTIDEMVSIVSSALLTMGLAEGFADLVLIVGHGSSSLNNPHEAAHDCGATGGGRGGPNARAFSMMANHPEVRLRLEQEHGLCIPETTWFVGGYHNTCDDLMTYYDEDLVPTKLRERLSAVKKAMSEACSLDAHERCRRFETAPRRLAAHKAMAVAEQHANDLAEPRPEYGHATNAVCIVGRRSRTRGLFLDRRAFLVSYDPTQDPTGDLLASLLLSVGPVGAGINLEYYFSFVDPDGYGSGTKLPHNITGLIGVMDGHATDLRTGLPWQMVEIHEPVRLLTIVEAKREVLEAILDREPALAQLIANGWIQFVAWDPDSDEMRVFDDGVLRAHQSESDSIPIVQRSIDHYKGHHGHLASAHVLGAFGAKAS